MANVFDQFDGRAPDGRPRIEIRPAAKGLDLDPRSRDLVVRTILGEAGGEGDDGQAGVAAVIANRLRSGKFGKSAADVVLAPNQFEPWSRLDARQRMLGYSPDSPEYKRANAALERVLAGDDPTGGATHFFAPAAQAALGREAPKWATGEPTVIGRHNFYAPDGKPKAAQAIDRSRPIINNSDGSFSTERTITVGFDDGYYNIPTIVDGKQVSESEAIQHFKAGRNKAVGHFATQQEAEAAAKARSGEIGRVRGAEAQSGRNPFDQFDAPAARPQEAASFNSRFAPNPVEALIAPEMSGIPSNAATLAPAMRRAADERLVSAAGETPGGTFASSAMNTMLLNIPRNISAGLAAATTDIPFSEAYQGLKDIDEASARLNPKSAIAGTVAGVVGGAVALPGLGGAATTAGRMGQAAVTGAGYAAASELLDSKDPVKAAVAAGFGAALGAVAAPIAEKVVNVVTSFVKRGKTDVRFLNNDGTLTQEAVDAAKAAGIDPADFHAVLSRAYASKFADRGASPSTARDAAAGEFGIKLSPGQSTGDFTRTKYERDAAGGLYGPFATKAARGFFDEQTGQVQAARGGVQDELAGGSRVVESVDEAAQVVREGIKRKAGEARADFKGKYERAFDQEGEFSDIAFRGVGDRIGRALSDSPNPVIIDDVTTPIAARAIRDLDNISNLKIQNLADPSGAPDPSKIVAVNLRGVEQARKRLVSFYTAAKSKGDASDIRATQRVIDAFDDEIEQAITTGLFTGSDDALKAIKEARMAYRDYRRTFTPQGRGDDVGQGLQKIIERDATAGEVANYLYGASQVGEKGVSSRMAVRLKQVFGEGSEEWSAVKQGLWMRLTSKPEGMTDFGPQAMSERIFKFLHGPGADTARAIFGKEELAKMGRLAVAMKNVVPPKDAVNWSGTAYTMAALQGGGLGGTALWFGSDPATAASLAALRVGGKFGRDVLRGRSASKHFASGPPSTVQQPGGAYTGSTGVAGGLSGKEAEEATYPSR